VFDPRRPAAPQHGSDRRVPPGAGGGGAGGVLPRERVDVLVGAPLAFLAACGSPSRRVAPQPPPPPSSSSSTLPPAPLLVEGSASWGLTKTIARPRFTTPPININGSRQPCFFFFLSLITGRGMGDGPHTRGPGPGTTRRWGGSTPPRNSAPLTPSRCPAMGISFRGMCDQIDLPRVAGPRAPCLPNKFYEKVK